MWRYFLRRRVNGAVVCGVSSTLLRAGIHCDMRFWILDDTPERFRLLDVEASF
jgi:hypothetical protein